MTSEPTSDAEVPSDLEATARMLLVSAGLHPSEQETALLVEQYPAHMTRLKALWGMFETRYAAPALVFDPTPVFVDWF